MNCIGGQVVWKLIAHVASCHHHVDSVHGKRIASKEDQFLKNV